MEEFSFTYLGRDYEFGWSFLPPATLAEIGCNLHPDGEAWLQRVLAELYLTKEPTKELKDGLNKIWTPENAPFLIAVLDYLWRQQRAGVFRQMSVCEAIRGANSDHLPSARYWCMALLATFDDALSSETLLRCMTLLWREGYLGWGYEFSRAALRSVSQRSDRHKPWEDTRPKASRLNALWYLLRYWDEAATATEKNRNRDDMMKWLDQKRCENVKNPKAILYRQSSSHVINRNRFSGLLHDYGLTLESGAKTFEEVTSSAGANAWRTAVANLLGKNVSTLGKQL